MFSRGFNKYHLHEFVEKTGGISEIIQNFVTYRIKICQGKFIQKNSKFTH